MENLDNISEKIIALERKRKKLTVFYVILPVIAATIGLIIVLDKVASAEQLLEQKRKERTLLDSEIAVLKKTKDTLNQNYRNLSAKEWGISDSILKSNTADKNIKAGFESDSLISILMKQDPRLREANKKIQVQYFHKNADEGRIGSSLQDLGFNLVETEGKNENKTNFIAFGPGININSVKVISLALVRAGIELKAISPFIISSGKNNKIQIGYYSKLEKEKTIATDSIITTKEFKIYRGL